MAKLFLLIPFVACNFLFSRPVAAQAPAGATHPFTAPAGAAQARLTTTPSADATLQAAIHFADSLFHRGSFLYERAEPDIPEDIQDILIRFNNSIVANQQWFLDYKNTYAGQPLPYNQRFGISAEEYRRLQNLEKTPPRLVAVDTQNVTIIREAGYIRFKTAGDIHLLDYLQIDLRQLLVVYGGDTIPFVGRTSTTAGSPYGEWQGYTWRLEKADAPSTIATSRVTARVVEINLGLPAQGGPQSSPTSTPPTPTSPTPPPTSPPIPAPDKKAFLRIKYQDMRDGVTTANLEIVGYLH